jgi:uncharacterized OsmC-like protein
VGRFRGVKFDTPIKFGGKERYPCPDELFLSGVAGCLLTTFLHFRKRLSVNLEGLEVFIKGSLQTGPGGYRISGIEVAISAKAKRTDVTGVRKCIKLAKEYCHITRTLEKVVPMQITEEIEIVTKPKTRNAERQP